MPYKSKEREKLHRKEYYSKNRLVILERANKYRLKNLEEVKLRKKQYYENNKANIRAKAKLYASKNLSKFAEYRRNRMKNDIQFRLGARIRNRMWKITRGKHKSGSGVKDLGCSINELKFYLEGKFTDGMSWDNYGKWEIDHIIPLTFFDLSDREQFLQACHYTNLQPMWAKDNKIKGNRLSPMQGKLPVAGMAQ